MSRRPPVVLPEVTMSELDGVRHLHLGTEWVQGSMRVKSPYDIELAYVQRMMAWLLLRPTADMAKGHAVQLGLGAAAITKFCHKRLRMRSTAVELNPQVVAVCRQYFRLPPDDAKLAVVLGDAGAWVADPAHAGTVHALCVDLYDHEAAAPVLDGEDFYRQCHAVLADGRDGHQGGVMAVNLFGRQASYPRSLQAICAAFGDEHVWTATPTREGNTIVYGLRGLPAPTRADMLERARVVEARWKLPAGRWLRMLRPVRGRVA